jgi:hypothetical protein
MYKSWLLTVDGFNVVPQVSKVCLVCLKPYAHFLLTSYFFLLCQSPFCLFFDSLNVTIFDNSYKQNLQNVFFWLISLYIASSRSIHLLWHLAYLLVFWVFETSSLYVARLASNSPPECYDYRHVPPHFAINFSFYEESRINSIP